MDGTSVKRAISLWPPWNDFIARGFKKIETRSWRCPGRLPRVLAIHATVYMPDLTDILNGPDGPHYRAALEALGCPVERSPLSGRWVAGLAALPRGAIVATARVVECVRTELLVASSAYHLSERERAFGDYAAGRFGWILDGVQPIDPPIPCRGHQSIWEVPADIEARIQAALGGSSAGA